MSGAARGQPTVAIVGGGLAGLAAAAAAVEHGLRVELFDERGYLGGRASSFRDPHSGQLIDHCQHMAMGCCTNLADFCRRTGIDDCFSTQKELYFFGPEGTRYPFVANSWLPAPLHLAPALMNLKYLTLGERLSIAVTIARLTRQTDETEIGEETIGQWLRRRGQSDRAIGRFWSPLLVSALGETVDRTALSAAWKVFVDGFLGSRHAYELRLPALPLREIFDRRAGQWLARRGVAIHRRTPIARIEGDRQRAAAVVLPDGLRRPFDFFVVAVPWHKVGSLLPDVMHAALPELDGVHQIEAAPIAAVHLWFDRRLTRLPNAVLVDRLSQWVFQPDVAESSLGLSEQAFYCQVVISAARPLSGRRREEIVAQVRSDLEAIWPATRQARLVHWRVVTAPNAVFSVRPGLDALRPAQETAIGNLMLAGDWTATCWPATMESAVRSGYLAVEAIFRRLGRGDRVLVDDLPRNWLLRRLIRQ